MNSFRAFCRQATDAQLENILAKEWYASRPDDEGWHDEDRLRDYNEAVLEAESRGWMVRRGERI